MPATLTGQLVVAISSRALFDFEAENRVFEAGDDRAYMALQQRLMEEPAPPGVATTRKSAHSASAFTSPK